MTSGQMSYEFPMESLAMSSVTPNKNVLEMFWKCPRIFPESAYDISQCVLHCIGNVLETLKKFLGMPQEFLKEILEIDNWSNFLRNCKEIPSNVC